MNTPHDHLVKQAFGDIALARAFLLGALPPALAEAVDGSTLQMAPSSHVDEQLAARHLDLLFQVKLREGGPLLLHVLLEHQSTPDDLMGRRIYRYVHHVWTWHERSHPAARALPPVISLVLYHGLDPWPGRCRLHDQVALAGVPPEAAPYVPDLRYLLLDLRRTADARLTGTALGRLVLLLLKYAADGDLWARLPEWIDLLVQIWRAPDGPAAMTAIVRYISYTTPEAPPPEVKDLIRAHLGEPAMDVLESWADKLLAQGEARGEAHGRLDGKREVLLNLAQARFGSLPSAFVLRVESADSATLDRWSLRLLRAASCEDVVHEG